MRPGNALLSVRAELWAPSSCNVSILLSVAMCLQHVPPLPVRHRIIEAYYVMIRLLTSLYDGYCVFIRYM